ncbi:MAG: hypothetical protein ABSH56_09075 [Bryobacteraceae bacterium]|jgi:hypothetical protein
MFDLQRVLGPHADGLPNSVAMLRAPLEHLENEQVERTPHEFDAVGHVGRYSL